MTRVRYECYRSVLAVLDELESPELKDDERFVLRDTAEGLLLSRSGKEQERDEVLLDAWRALSGLVRTGRWEYRAAYEMQRMLEACGPDRPRGARRRRHRAALRSRAHRPGREDAGAGLDAPAAELQQHRSAD